MKVVITGASRGIGLELTRVALEKGNTVMAIAREPKKSAGLNDLVGKFASQLLITQADFGDFSASGIISKALQDWNEVDLLINNAGIMRQGTAAEDFMESFQVNSVTPFLVTQALLPWLKKSKRPTAVHITSLMGSIADNSSGGYYAYRSSKTALNMINKSLSRDLKWLTTLVVHPGWVQTDMGGAGAPVTPAKSVVGIWQVAENSGLAQSGQFFNYDGKSLPW